MKKNRWIGLTRILIVFFTMILYFNAYALFTEIKRSYQYSDRSYGLSAFDECFENGEYYSIYRYTLANQFTNDKPEIDTSQYEAFGRYYNAYLMSKAYEGDQKYLDIMKEEKAKISWKKITSVIERLEKQD